MSDETKAKSHFASADQLGAWMVTIAAHSLVDLCTTRLRAYHSIQSQHAININAYGKDQAKTVAQLWQEVGKCCWPACTEHVTTCQTCSVCAA